MSSSAGTKSSAERASEIASRLVPRLVELYEAGEAERRRRWSQREEADFAWLQAHWPRLVHAVVAEMEEELASLLADDRTKNLRTVLSSTVDLLSPLGQTRREVTHTQILGFILNPAEEHGLGDRPLQALFDLVCRINPATTDRIAGVRRDLGRALVRTELPFRLEVDDQLGRTDIWGEIPADQPRLMFVIENKVDAAVTTKQLESYEAALNARLRGRNLGTGDSVRILLTDEHLPRIDGWVLMRWRDVALALADTAASHGDGAALLRLYLATLLTRFEGIQYPAQSHRDRSKLRTILKQAARQSEWQRS